MFCDLVDSTRLAGELDPEDMRDVVVAYQRACAGAIAAHSGFLARYLGDGVLAYFGYPEAHEDDARLAVGAGLAVVDAVAALGARFGRDDLQVRIGVHTGEVVVTDAGDEASRQPHEIVGETPNLAARLQSAAWPGTVVISDGTRVLVEGFFAVDSIGELTLKGIRRPVSAFRVLRPTDARTRLDAVASRGLTPFVGRDGELAELLEHWDTVGAGGARVVLMSGEPGIGKSRLAHELCHSASASGGATLRLRCSPYNASSTLFPFVEHFMLCGSEHGEAGRLDRLKAYLSRLGMDIDTTMPLIAELLAIPTGSRYPPSSDSPVRRKQRTLETLFAWLQAQSVGQPLLVVIERPVGRSDHARVPRPLLQLRAGAAADAAAHAPRQLRASVGASRTRASPGARSSGRDAMHAMVLELTQGRALPAELEAQIGARPTACRCSSRRSRTRCSSRDGSRRRRASW